VPRRGADGGPALPGAKDQPESSCRGYRHRGSARSSLFSPATPTVLAGPWSPSARMRATSRRSSPMVVAHFGPPRRAPDGLRRLRARAPARVQGSRPRSSPAVAAADTERKVDRAALPEPAPRRRSGRRPGPVRRSRRRTALEAKLLAVWQEVPCAAERDRRPATYFFDLGVDSLTAGALFHEDGARLAAAPAPVRRFRRRRRSERLAAALEQERGDSRRWSSLVPPARRSARRLRIVACTAARARPVLQRPFVRQPRRRPARVYRSRPRASTGVGSPGTTSVPQMARAYVSELTAAFHRPVHPSAGYCYARDGGLRDGASSCGARGADVLQLVMLNAPSPTYNAVYQPIFDESGPVANPGPGEPRNRGPRQRPLRRAASPRPLVGLGGADRLGQGRSRRGRGLPRRRGNAAARGCGRSLAAAMRLRRPLPDRSPREAPFQRNRGPGRSGSTAPRPTRGQMVVFSLARPVPRGRSRFGAPTSAAPSSATRFPAATRTPRDAMREPAVGFIAGAAGGPPGRRSDG